MKENKLIGLKVLELFVLGEDDRVGPFGEEDLMLTGDEECYELYLHSQCGYEQFKFYENKTIEIEFQEECCKPVNKTFKTVKSFINYMYSHDYFMYSFNRENIEKVFGKGIIKEKSGLQTTYFMI